MNLGLVWVLLDENSKEVVDALCGVFFGKLHADVTQQDVQLSIHVKLLGGEGTVDLLFIGYAVASGVIVLGAGKIDVAVIGLI